MKLRRTLLYVPGNNPGLVQNCSVFGPDSIMLDLEDAVLASEKDAARILVVEALKSVDFRGIEVLVRINGLDSELGFLDLAAIMPAKPDGIRFPKVNGPRDIAQMDELLTKYERQYGIEEGKTFIIASLESALAIENAFAIASASPRMQGIAIGAEDYTADLKTTRSREGTELFFARSAIVTAARAAGIMAIDTVFSDINDEEGLINEAKLVKQLGFDGKSVISPRQIAPVHEVFRPTEKEIEKAAAIIGAFEDAKAKGSGVVALNGKMIDRPVVLRAQRVMELAKG
ncbi:MAG TPA: citrate lyase subunit beta [Cyanobacteria bacterium UBA8530]|nr:citrate lyase subunit beta [Cyanobacteria bacterium UBA8530]